MLASSVTTDFGTVGGDICYIDARFAMHPLLRPVETILPRAARQFGGKARNLASLARAGFPVPAAYVLSSEATDLFLSRTLPSEWQLPRLLQMTPVDGTLLDEIRGRIVTAEVPAEVTEALRLAYGELSHAGAGAVVLRPSRVIGEDVESAVSGLHESSMALGSTTAVVEAAKRCWASLYTPASISCAASLGPELIGSLALVVQAMVPSEASGTLWTANPLTHDPSEMTLEAVRGFRAGMRDTTIVPDHYQIDRRTHWIRDRVVGRKQHAHLLSTAQTMVITPIEGAAQLKEALDDHTLRQMVDLGQRIEAHFGDPREIQWAVVADAVYVLKARPLAARRGMIAIPPSAKGRDDRDLASAQWLSIGAVESLADVATPLTWSAIHAFCGTGLHKALAKVSGAPPRQLQGIRSQRGRPYLEASEVSLLGPGASLLVDGLARPTARDTEHTSRLSQALSAPLSMARYARRRTRRIERLDGVERGHQVERARLLAIDPRILSGVGLADTMFDAQRMLDRLMRELVRTTAAMTTSWMMLRRALEGLAPKRARALELGLLCAIDELYASDPVLALEPVAAVCRDEAVRASLLGAGLSDLRFEQLPGHAVQGPLARFLSEHGHGARQDLELASPRWCERPGLALSFALSPLWVESSSTAHADRRMAEQRWQHAQRELGDRWGSALIKPVLNLAQWVRRDIVQREQVRAWVGQALWLLRRCVVDGARRLSVREAMARDDAAYLLSLDELRSALRGEIRSVAQIVTLRRTLQRQTEALPSPPDGFTGYPQPMTPPTAWSSVRGTAVSPGVAMGRACIIASIEDVQRARPGDVLVLRHLDPAWSLVACRAGAVAAQLGGVASSGAVMLRQHGVPCVSNLGLALRSVRQGETLRVDGDEGLIERAPAHP